MTCCQIVVFVKHPYKYQDKKRIRDPKNFSGRELRQSSRGVPRGSPLSHHRAYLLGTTAVSIIFKRLRQGSLSVRHRRNLPRLVPLRSGSAFSVWVVESWLQWEFQLIASCLLLLHFPRDVQCCSLNDRFGPSPCGYYGLC